MERSETTVWAADRKIDSSVEQDYLVLARTIRQLNRQVYGLWAVPAKFDLGTIPIRLGKALAALGSKVGVLEPRHRWRATIAQDRITVSEAGEAFETLVPNGASASSTGTIIDEALIFARHRYDCLLLDLSGLDLVETHEISLVPDIGIVLFVARGQINEFALARICRQLPEERLLGAVLMDVLPNDTLIPP